MKFVTIASLAAGLTLSGAAQALTVSSLTDIWLAGQPSGSTLTGFFGTDTAPGNSPVQIAAVGGQTLTFTASGSTSVDGACFAGPDGGCYADELPFGTGPVNGIGSYQGPSNALYGVFLDASIPSGAGGPASLDFTMLGNISMLSNTPLLNQIFFIGDGLTGTGSGSLQSFLAPLGATRLFIAVADSVGSSTGNSGSLDVTYTISGLTSGVPEPATWALMIAGFGLVGATLRRRSHLTA